MRSFLEVVQESLVNGRSVRLYGFGTWEVRSRHPRRVRPIRDLEGEWYLLPKTTHVHFSVGNGLARKVRENHESNA